MDEGKVWDWTIEASDSGFYFIEMKCSPVFGGGRYTKEQTILAAKEFSEIYNPNVPRTKQEGRDLIEKIKQTVLNRK